MLPTFTYQKLIVHIDGTSTAPSSTIVVDSKTVPNPVVVPWNELDQRVVILLQSSLTEESTAEVLGLTTARQIWLSLEAAYSNASVERVHSLRDSLRQLTKAHPVVEIDKLHWFLCGLGPSYETFSTAMRATKPAPLFCDLVTQAESHELFMLSLHGTSTPPVAFQVQNTTSNNSHGRGGSFSSRGTSSRGRGRGQNRRPPHCQLCRTNGYYASACPSLATYATQASTTDESLAKAFHAQCHVTTNSPDWHVDSRRYTRYQLTSLSEIVDMIGGKSAPSTPSTKTKMHLIESKPRDQS
ncbi:putative RNA-directed DNA polymerase [Tanacetum coccineum]|uniref:RNA-directed DNA polymerase n=1 Tax=Tanacetum coccineum TaxID=301880 RepID=A0ABQ4YMU7_9ASTR